MYIDPHTEFHYDNDETQAKWTMIGLLMSAIAFSVLMIAILKTSVTI